MCGKACLGQLSWTASLLLDGDLLPVLSWLPTSRRKPSTYHCHPLCYYVLAYSQSLGESQSCPQGRLRLLPPHTHLHTVIPMPCPLCRRDGSRPRMEERDGQVSESRVKEGVPLHSQSPNKDSAQLILGWELGFFALGTCIAMAALQPYGELAPGFAPSDLAVCW